MGLFLPTIYGPKEAAVHDPGACINCAEGLAVAMDRCIMCFQHIRRNWKGEDASAEVRATEDWRNGFQVLDSTLRRFMAHVARGEGCWVWTGSLNSGGYGQFYFAGKPVSAHRFIYQMLVSRLKLDHQIDHLCRNRACVNPDHLDQVSGRENMQRAHVARGNSVRAPEVGWRPFSAVSSGEEG